MAQRRSHLAALGGVVEHHVEQHLEPGRVQRGDHGPELGHLAARAAGPDGRRVAVMGGEEPDGVVAPVVGEPPLDQERLRHVLVHRQQLDRGHPEAHQVGDRGVVAQPRVGAAQLPGHSGVGHREPLDVHLIDHCVGVAVARPRGLGHVDAGVDHQAPGDVRGRVEPARPVGIGDVVTEDLGSEPHRPGRGPRVGVEQQLGRVAAHPAGRVPGAGGAVAVRLAGAHPFDEAVPDPGVVLRQGDAGLGACVVEQAQQHAVGHARRHRKVGPVRAKGGPQREAAARAQPHLVAAGAGHGRARPTTRPRSPMA